MFNYKMIGLFTIFIILLLGYFLLNSEGFENTKVDEQKKENNEKKKENDYIYSSYSEGDRGKDDEWTTIHENSNNIITDKQTQGEVLSNDIGNEQYAKYSDDDKKIDEHDPKNLYNADNYLPKEVNDDWFETVKEPIPIKNRHLINTTRTIGLDTIGSSKKNATRDIRGEDPNPKFTVSPFLNSSIEPQMTNRGLFN